MIVIYPLLQKLIIMNLLLSSILLVWSHLPNLYTPKYKELGIVLDLWSIKLVTRKIKIFKPLIESGMLMLMLLLLWETTMNNILPIHPSSPIECHTQDKIEQSEQFQTTTTSPSLEIKDICHNSTYKAKIIINRFVKPLHNLKVWNNKTCSLEEL